MDADSLLHDLDYLSCVGIVLSAEQRASLQSSLVLLKNKEKFHSVVFWGKISGIVGQYFIVQGRGRDPMKGRKNLYSNDCRKWAQLPVLDASEQEKALKVSSRFMGDASYEAEYIEPPVADEKGDPTNVVVREENRLAAIVNVIDETVFVAPRGSYIRTPQGNVQKNPSFSGLALAKAGLLSSYLHFREPKLLEHKTLLQRSNLDKSIDFMDSIDEDIPSGCWSLQMVRGGDNAVLKSLWWPGYAFFHVPGTKKCGGLYWGTGQQNRDLPFML
eukprot:m.6602 g.6602  ORF g.6602 m.6602 type:complete len:273 (+) comp16380_c0_seq1:29-847(+)